MARLTRTSEYVRSTIFGIEDSLVSTTGIVAGVSAGSHHRPTILLAAIVAVTIEAMSMAAGEFLSDEAVHEMNKRRRAGDSAMVSATLMFFAYLLAGAIPIVPVIVFAYPSSIFISIFCSLIGLFILGYVKGRVVRVNATRSGLKILLIGGVTAIVGVIVGHFLKAV
ncbi:MAG TPA: VIT1/CCC1 transporter family protein [Candidatus Saccharimonadales bacterium]|nr:VIT1/CCC1 transporter family protein [Candidatus Saccharimonadales bacterium]